MDLEPLRAWNPHWYGHDVSPRILKHANQRTLVARWLDELANPPDDRWGLKAGPRQVGKTTSLGHVAHGLIHDVGVEPRRVAIVPMDDEAVLEASQGKLRDILSTLAEVHAPAAGKPNFLLLDELQGFPDWAAQLKTAWDRHHAELRVLATGSSALQLRRPPSADIHGRIRTVTVHPMKFREVLMAHPAFRERTDEPTRAQIQELAKAARESLRDGHEAFGRALGEFHGVIHAGNLHAIVRQIWMEYCAWGGFPATRPGASAGPVEKLDRFEGALNTILARDVVIKGVRKLRSFRRVLRHIARNPGGKFEPYSIGNRVDAGGSVVEEWKRILEDVMVVQQLAPLKPNLQPANGRDKAYSLDPGWTSYFRGHAAPALDPDDALVGLIVESVIVDHARRLRFNVAGTTALPIGFVERPETDIALDLGGRWLLIEVKYRTQPDSNLSQVGDDDAIRVVTTKDRFETSLPGATHFLPSDEFALIC